MRSLDFQDHRRELEDNRYIYAVVSRRSRGLSIGVNLNPDKTCNFDCPYCQVDRTVPGGEREVDLTRLERELSHLLELVVSGRLWEIPPFDSATPELRRVNDIAIAGDGEPTACPVFAGAVERIGRLRSAFGLDGVQVYVLTNATLLHRPRVKAGIEALDRIGGRIWAKLDAGTDPYFKRVDGTRLPLQRVVDNIKETARERPVILQCMFMRWQNEGPSEAEKDAWADRLREIRDAGGLIELVQVYSVARKPADPRVGVLPLDELEAIADRARTLGLSVQVFPGIEA